VETKPMKTLIIPALALAVVGAAGAPAAAQSWQDINARQAKLDTRIDQGVRNGALTQPEAIRLRAEFRDIANLEARYRRDGLSSWERSDLDRRFDALSTRIRLERTDDDRWGRNGWRDNRGQWTNINARQAELDRRIDLAISSGQVSRREAIGLRNDFRTIANLEARYRTNGLSNWERQDLDRRFDQLAARVRLESYDRDGRRDHRGARGGTDANAWR
jgi:hypothetical protein